MVSVSVTLKVSALIFVYNVCCKMKLLSSRCTEMNVDKLYLTAYDTCVYIY